MRSPGISCGTPGVVENLFQVWRAARVTWPAARIISSHGGMNRLNGMLLTFRSGGVTRGRRGVFSKINW